jgi:hypothetical protein
MGVLRSGYEGQDSDRTKLDRVQGEVPSPRTVPPPAQPQRITPPPYVGGTDNGRGGIQVSKQACVYGKEGTHQVGRSSYEGHLTSPHDTARGQKAP